ncbi:TraR/DksA C4-type zinc finger protein [Pseudalkalibacillus caeni]|uniref:TraR/DksA family transcriptional regulator n=1 Tax=Exobacillus caeni TaxID=2574798 RepID=A0A5R9FGW6_9BACL|nr:TraR/DksA C4-type zinc finger protein [Pseudalkalibacillus caeni]TLS38785.1 TraR/DksA family transcriptional regulator [Pseudalkalibacillus caeni]
MPLSQEELKHYKKKLLDLKKDILERNSNEQKQEDSLSEDNELNSVDNHFADLATQLYLREREMTIDDVEQNRLDNINAALDRIREGNYGICIDTGKEISKERLDAMPYASRTIQAQREFDQKRNARIESQTDEKSYATPLGELREDSRIRTADNIQSQHGNSSVENYDHAGYPSDEKGDGD